MATRTSMLSEAGLQFMVSDYYNAQPRRDAQGRAVVEFVDCKLHPFALRKITDAMWRYLKQPNEGAQLQVRRSAMLVAVYVCELIEQIHLTRFSMRVTI